MQECCDTIQERGKVMKFAHFFDEGELSEINEDELRVLVDQCDFIRRKQLSEVVCKDDFKSVICVCDDKGSICGFASVVVEYGYLQLNALFVSDEARGRGYGKALIKEVKAFASHMGLDMVQLIALEDSKSALSLYEKTGFVYLSKHSYFTSDMRMYVKDLPYLVGGMLNAIACRYGRQNLSEGLLSCKQSGDLSVFDNAFKMRVKSEVVQNVLNGKFIGVCARALDKLGGSKRGEETVKRLMFKTLEGNYKKEYVDKFLPGVSREAAHDFSLCLDAYYSFEKQDRLEMIDANKDKIIVRG